MNRADRCLVGIAAAFATGLLSAMLGGCVAPDPGPGPEPVAGTNGIPNLRLVEASIWRGGQPDVAGWTWLKAAGVSNVVKLNTMVEASDAPAANMGMAVHYHPVNTLEQLVGGPDPDDFTRARAEIGPGTFIHCEHGQDRTGLLIGLYRLQEGTNAAAAWQEMTNCGFHPALQGLTRYWNAAARGVP